MDGELDDLEAANNFKDLAVRVYRNTDGSLRAHELKQLLTFDSASDLSPLSGDDADELLRDLGAASGSRVEFSRFSALLSGKAPSPSKAAPGSVSFSPLPCSCTKQ